LEDILSAAAQPQYGGPRSLTVISHDMSVAREHAYAALYAEPAVPPNISVGELDGDRRVLFTDKGLIGTVTVGVELHKGPVIEAQLVRTPGTGKDCAALPHEVDAVIKAVDNWAAGRTATGRQIRPHKATMPTPSASVTQNWLA